MNRSAVLLATVLFAVLTPEPALADTIYLKSGSKFEGKVEEKDDQVILHLENGSKMSFPRKMVVHVEKGPAPWEVYARKVKQLEAGDAAAHLELAKWCRAKKLRKRAARHLEAVIKLKPEDAEAHKLLGHEKFEGRWMSREEILKAKGYVEVEGKWLSPEEYAAHEAQSRAKEAKDKELKRLQQLDDQDAEKARAARRFYMDRGKDSLQNLLWGVVNLKDSKDRLEAVKLINRIGPTEKVHSLWIAQAAVKEGNTDCIKELCAGIKKRDDAAAMTYLVLWAAGRSVYRRKSAYCLGLINDKRCYKALIGCIAGQPKNTLPGGAGMSLTQLGNMATGAAGMRGGGVSVGGGEVVPAADSMEYISGKDYKNDVGKWMKWLDSLDKAPGGAVIDTRKKK